MINKLEKQMTLEERRSAVKKFLQEGQHEIVKETETVIQFKIDAETYHIDLQKGKDK